MIPWQKSYRLQIRDYLGPDMNVFLFWKARVALYAILQAAGVKEGDEIILPALTCVVVPNAIMYLKAKPVYADVDPRTYTIDPNRLSQKITRKTKAILAQNTFGLSPDLDEIRNVAKRHGLMVIEDCAHGFGGTYKGRPNGTVADAAFFSTQWNKPYSTGIGGFAVTRSPQLAVKLSELEDQACLPSIMERMLLRSQLFASDYLLSGAIYWPAVSIYRFLSRHDIVVGSSQGKELEGPNMPAAFLKSVSSTQARRGIRELGRMAENLEHRRRIAALYKGVLSNLGVEAPFEPDYAAHTLLKFPLLVRDRREFLRRAEKSKIEIGDWFLSPLHPIENNLHRWHYVQGENPVAEGLSAHLVNLHTHMRIDEHHVMKVGGFLKDNRRNIFDSVEECLAEQTLCAAGGEASRRVYPA